MLDLSTPPIYPLYSFTDSDCWISILLLKVSSDITHLSRGSFQVKLHISKTRLLSNQDVTTSKLCMSRFYFDLPYPNFFRSFSEGIGHHLEQFGFKITMGHIPLLAKYFTGFGKKNIFQKITGVYFFLNHLSIEEQQIHFNHLLKKYNTQREVSFYPFHRQLHNCTRIQICHLTSRVYILSFWLFAKVTFQITSSFEYIICSSTAKHVSRITTFWNHSFV